MPQENKKCHCAEMTCQEGCRERHTHKGFFCEKYKPEQVKQMSTPEKTKDYTCPKGCGFQTNANKYSIAHICNPPEKKCDQPFGMNCETGNCSCSKSTPTPQKQSEWEATLKEQFCKPREDDGLLEWYDPSPEPVIDFIRKEIEKSYFQGRTDGQGKWKSSTEPKIEIIFEGTEPVEAIVNGKKMFEAGVVQGRTDERNNQNGT